LLKFPGNGHSPRKPGKFYDELVFEVTQKDHMENAMKLAMPLEVDFGVGDSWDEAH